MSREAALESFAQEAPASRPSLDVVLGAVDVAPGLLVEDLRLITGLELFVALPEFSKHFQGLSSVGNLRPQLSGKAPGKMPSCTKAAGHRALCAERHQL